MPVIKNSDLGKLKRPMAAKAGFVVFLRDTTKDYRGIVRQIKLRGTVGGGDREIDPDLWPAEFGTIPTAQELTDTLDDFRVYRLQQAKFKGLKAALDREEARMHQPSRQSNLGLDGDLLEDFFSLYQTVAKLIQQGDYLTAKKILEDEPMDVALEPVRNLFVRHFPLDSFLRGNYGQA